MDEDLDLEAGQPSGRGYAKPKHLRGIEFVPFKFLKRFAHVRGLRPRIWLALHALVRSWGRCGIEATAEQIAWILTEQFGVPTSAATVARWRMDLPDRIEQRKRSPRMDGTGRYRPGPRHRCAGTGIFRKFNTGRPGGRRGPTREHLGTPGRAIAEGRAIAVEGRDGSHVTKIIMLRSSLTETPRFEESGSRRLDPDSLKTTAIVGSGPPAIAAAAGPPPDSEAVRASRASDAAAARPRIADNFHEAHHRVLERARRVWMVEGGEEPAPCVFCTS